MFRVDDPRSEPRVLHEMTQNKIAEDAESDFAIPFVDENDYSEISADFCESCVSETEIKKESPFLSCIELTVEQGDP